jgi:hypothetical protein
MEDESESSGHLRWLEAEHHRVSDILNRLEAIIDDLERAPFLRADAAARLAKYRQSREHHEHQRRRLTLEMQRLRSDLPIDAGAPIN